MVLKFPDSADSADLAAAGYSQVIILGGGTMNTPGGSGGSGVALASLSSGTRFNIPML